MFNKTEAPTNTNGKNNMQPTEIKISYINPVPKSERTRIISSETAFDYMTQVYGEGSIELRESFYAIFLDNNNTVKGHTLISTGGITGTMVDIRILFAIALKSLSVAVILVHNHPSGTEKPSQQDRDITDKIKKAGEQLDIKILDHLIMTPQKTFYSFADNGDI